ncbi:MAG: phage holin family protein [Chthoniobacterales bacterium]|jgi:hypothetical protein
MHPSPGAERPASPEPPGLSAAASDFSASAIRFSRALTGLFGLELRESGWHALLLAALALALLLALVFGYVFLLLAAGLAVVESFGAGLIPTALGLGLLHVAAACALVLVLRARIKRPLFPGTREAVRREVERLS